MTLERIQTGPRMSQAVIHSDTVYLAGVVADDRTDTSPAQQTMQILSRIDALLAAAGSDKSRLLTATVWLRDIAYYDALNTVWDKWVAFGATPARACVEARMATPDILVEIQVTAARTQP